jgi:hypothetical protein
VVIGQNSKLGYPVFVGYLVVCLAGAVGTAILLFILWMRAIDKYHEQQSAKPISDAELDKRIESAIQRRQSLEKPQEPHWMATHVPTGKSVHLIVFFYGTPPGGGIGDAEISIRCLVTTPNRSLYVSDLGSASRVAITMITLRSQIKYPEEFDGAPELGAQVSTRWNGC